MRHLRGNDSPPSLARTASTWRLPSACAALVLLALLLPGCGSSGSAATTSSQPAAAGQGHAGEAAEHPSTAAAGEVRHAEAQEKLESEQERLRAEQASKEAERLTGTVQAPSEPPETAIEQREHVLTLGL